MSATMPSISSYGSSKYLTRDTRKSHIYCTVLQIKPPLKPDSYCKTDKQPITWKRSKKIQQQKRHIIPKCACYYRKPVKVAKAVGWILPIKIEESKLNGSVKSLKIVETSIKLSQTWFSSLSFLGTSLLNDFKKIIYQFSVLKFYDNDRKI